MFQSMCLILPCITSSNIALYNPVLSIGQTIQDVRLVHPNNNTIGSRYEGRVEIRYNGTWGTICDHDWELEDAQVACRSLGFYGALRAVRNACYGGGTGRVWLDHVECVGMETSLDNCTHFPFGTVDSDCTDHSNDAGVVCFDGMYVAMYTDV